jgi:hypothetical protein
VGRPIFALNSWTVEERPNGWFFRETYGEDRTQFRGPYSSLASVTLMIARELSREVVRRHKRLEAAHAGLH